MPRADARSSASTRSREFAATPPPIRMSSIPSAAAASTALRVSTSQTASWNDAATSATGTGSPEASRACTHRATAVLSPEKLEVEAVPLEVAPRGQPAREVDRDRRARRRGAGRCRARPGTAARAAGPPCRRPRPPRRRSSTPAARPTRSRHRPAAARSAHRRRAWPGTGRAGPVLELVDGHVRGEVVHAVQRLLEPERQRLRRGDADEQRAGQARARRSPRSRRRRASATPAVSQARSIVGHHRLEVGPRRDLGYDARRTARAPRRDDATASASRVWPRTMPTPVSSHEVSMPEHERSVGQR